MTCFAILCSINLCQYFNNGKGINLIYLMFNGALGLWTIPTMAFFLTGIYFWAFYKVFKMETKAQAVSKLLLAGFSIIILTLCLYYPVAHYSGGYKALYSNEYVTSQSLVEFFSLLPEHLVNTMTLQFRGIPVIILVVAGLFFIKNFYDHFKANEDLSVQLLIFIGLGSFMLLIFIHRVPFVRTWIYLLIFVLLFLSKHISGFLNEKKGPLILSILFIAQCLYVIINRPVEEFDDTGLFPEIKEISTLLLPDIHIHEKVYVDLPGNAPFNYYRWYHINKLGISKTDVSEGGILYQYYILKNGAGTFQGENINLNQMEELYKSSQVTIYRTPWKKYYP